MKQAWGSAHPIKVMHGMRVWAAGVCLSAPLWGDAAGIYTCVDGHGKRHTSDRPIPECLDREQRVLNRDGSQKQVLPPRMNADERAAAEEREHQRQAQEAALKDAIRRDRNLMMRYPNEAVHQKARDAALDDLHNAIRTSEIRVADLQAERKPLVLADFQAALQGAIKTSEIRVADLQAERKPLDAESEFYKGKRLPGKLRTKMEANEAAQQAQKDVILSQKAEIVRINALYDTELARLKRLWAGAAPGSIPDPSASATAAASGAAPGINRSTSSSTSR